MHTQSALKKLPTHQEINSISAYCSRCDGNHTLSMAGAIERSRLLMSHLQQSRSISLQPKNRFDHRLLTEYLFSEARGKMFGVLQCRDRYGNIEYLYAFSGQFNGLWEVPGWAPPLFDVAEFNRVNIPQERKIKQLGATMSNLDQKSDPWYQLRKTRRDLSRNLMKELHGLYRLSNGRNETATLRDAYIENKGIPTGTGDCCGPKLLNQAYAKKLKPLALAEFYWGRENRSATRKHGYFYPPCREKCQPILGFMLCGTANSTRKRDDGSHA